MHCSSLVDVFFKSAGVACLVHGGVYSIIRTKREVDMPMLEILDNPVMDEYNRDEMELEIIAAKNADFENVQSRYV
ncbi:hypothetical protein QQ045_016905 [Rhodiola kirilowii]